VGVLPISPAWPTPAALDALVARHRGAAPTYAEVGATAGPLPDGYLHRRRTVDLGRGDAVFAAAAGGLSRWEAHRRSGAVVHPPGVAVAEGQVVAVAVRVALAWVTVVNRVVRVTEAPGLSGFAYGTLAHHVVEGEEGFSVRLDEAGTVRFEVVSFTRPRGRVLRLAGPVVHPLDDRLVRRYLRGMQRHVAGTA
jgi:uncharacterized protein (UPF0548 family)